MYTDTDITITIYVGNVESDSVSCLGSAVVGVAELRPPGHQVRGRDANTSLPGEREGKGTRLRGCGPYSD